MRRKFFAYLALTKPRIIELLLITTIPTMFLAQGGVPELNLIFFTLLGGALSAGSANAFNCYIDRDIDKIMQRTKKRPLVTGEISPKEALLFAWTLGIFSILILFFFVNTLSALLAVLAIFIYVVFYTIWLKRHTVQNIVWGGIAGCMPVFIGWAAVTNTISWEALVLFGIIFLWTPPHYWPLSLKYKEDYANAEVPMLPVLYAPNIVSIQIFLYSLAMVACSLLLIPLGNVGLVYATAAIVFGGWFLYKAYMLYRKTSNSTENNSKIDGRQAMKLFHASITYLTVIFIAVGLDPLINL